MTTKSYASMNKAELQAELDARKIEYNKEATNKELIAILETDDANSGSADEQKALENSGADGVNTPTPTPPPTNEEVEDEDEPTPVEKTEEQLLAEKLMADLGVKEVYQTKDGYWFSNIGLAKEHKAKIGGELQTFKAD